MPRQAKPATLLVEVGCEELPPMAVAAALEQLAAWLRGDEQRLIRPF